MASESKDDSGFSGTRKEKYDETLDATIPEAESLAASGRLIEAIDQILAVEKRARLAIIGVVQEGVTVLETLKTDSDRVKLITALRTVSEGKIYVEAERARLTTALANIREAEGKVAEACDIMQELTVETISSMESREKAELLLQQMRLTLTVKDWVRTGIMSGKVSKDILDKEGFEDLKLQFYDQLIALHTHEKDTWSLHSDYDARFNTPVVAADPQTRQEALSYAVIYTALTAWSDDVHSAMQAYLKSKAVKEELPPCAALLQLFVTPEIITWPLPGNAGLITNHPLVAGNQEHSILLHRRVVQHNIRVLAACYTRIRFARMCQLVGLQAKEAEKELSDMVTSGTVYARINRPEGIVSFEKPQAPHEVLGGFASNLRDLLSEVETTHHLIQREYMVHDVKTK